MITSDISSDKQSLLSTFITNKEELLKIGSSKNKMIKINEINYLKVILEIIQKINNIEEEIKKLNKRLDIIEFNQNKQINEALNSNLESKSELKKIINEIYEIKNTYKEDFEIKFLLDEKKLTKINKKDIEKNEGILFELKILNIGKYAIPNSTKLICKSLNNIIFFYPIQFKESIIITLISITNENNYENFDTNNYLIPGEIIQLKLKIFFYDNVEITKNKYSIKLDLESTENTIIKYNDCFIDVYIENDENDKIISSTNNENLNSNLFDEINSDNNENLNEESDLRINIKEGYNESLYGINNIKGKNDSKITLKNKKNLILNNSGTKNINNNICESDNIINDIIFNNNNNNNNNSNNNINNNINNKNNNNNSYDNNKNS